MSALAVTDDLFFNRAGLDRPRIEGIVSDALRGADDGELYLEYSQSESLGWDDGKLKSASFDTTQGFGLRGIAGDSPLLEPVVDDEPAAVLGVVAVGAAEAARDHPAAGSLRGLGDLRDGLGDHLGIRRGQHLRDGRGGAAPPGQPLGGGRKLGAQHRHRGYRLQPVVSGAGISPRAGR